MSAQRLKVPHHLSSSSMQSVGKLERTTEKEQNNPISRSAKLEASGDYKGAINVIEAEIEANPNSTLLPSYLDDLLSRKHAHDLKRGL